MTYAHIRPPARTVKSADDADKADKSRKVAPRELPHKLSVWQVIGIWLAVIMALPFVIFLFGLLSSVVGVEELIAPEIFYSIAKYTLLLATVFSAAIGSVAGICFLLVHRPQGEAFTLTATLLLVVAFTGLAALYLLVRD